MCYDLNWVLQETSINGKSEKCEQHVAKLSEATRDR